MIAVQKPTHRTSLLDRAVFAWKGIHGTPSPTKVRRQERAGARGVERGSRADVSPLVSEKEPLFRPAHLGLVLLLWPELRKYY